jgi:hypothetical protein
MILLLHAKIVVSYAAFVTARSASVWVPACYNGEGPNSLRLTTRTPSRRSDLISTSQSSSSKLDRIRSAAVLACAPISPSYFSWLSSYGGHVQLAGLPLAENLQGMTGPYQDALRRVDSIFTGEGTLGQAGRLVPRWFYSSLFTDVAFAGAEQADNIGFAENGDIQVTVEHKFYVQVPFVGRVLGQKYRYFLEKTSGGLLSSDTYYVPISESYTIRNEGERLYPGHCGG